MDGWVGLSLRPGCRCGWDRRRTSPRYATGHCISRLLRGRTPGPSTHSSCTRRHAAPPPAARQRTQAVVQLVVGLCLVEAQAGGVQHPHRVELIPLGRRAAASSCGRGRGGGRQEGRCGEVRPQEQCPHGAGCTRSVAGGVHRRRAQCSTAHSAKAGQASLGVVRVPRRTAHSRQRTAQKPGRPRMAPYALQHSTQRAAQHTEHSTAHSTQNTAQQGRLHLASYALPLPGSSFMP